MGKLFLITENQLKDIIKNKLQGVVKSKKNTTDSLIKESTRNNKIVLNENYIKQVLGPVDSIVKVSNLKENVNMALISLSKTNNSLRDKENLKKVVKTLKEYKDSGILTNFIVTSNREKVSLFFNQNKPIV